MCARGQKGRGESHLHLEGTQTGYTRIRAVGNREAFFCPRQRQFCIVEGMEEGAAHTPINNLNLCGCYSHVCAWAIHFYSLSLSFILHVTRAKIVSTESGEKNRRGKNIFTPLPILFNLIGRAKMRSIHVARFSAF